MLFRSMESSSSNTSTSTVGLPRESRISRARTASISAMLGLYSHHDDANPAGAQHTRHMAETSWETWRVLAVITVIGLVIAYIALSGVWVSSNGSWYRGLEQPAWQPPSWIFGLIWPYNFVVLAAVCSIICWRATPSSAGLVLIFLAASIACALAWANQFYGPHRMLLAAALLTSAAVLTLPVVWVAFRTGPVLGVLLLPYQIWVAIAASLSWGYAYLNTS